MTTHTHPAGTTVRYDGTNDPFAGKMFTVLDPDASSDTAIKNDRRRSTREFVEDSRGLHWWLEADMLTPILTMTTYQPGDRVQIDADRTPADAPKFGTVVDPTTPLTSPMAGGIFTHECEKVRTDGGQVQLWNRSRMTPILTLADEYPVGCTVRDVKYNLVGTVTGHRRQSGMSVLVVQFPGSVNTSVQTASFAHPEGRLERIHILTHEELTTLDSARRMSTPGDLGIEILDKHLRPTRTVTFMVTVEQPSSDNPVDAATLELVLGSDDSLSYPVTIAEAVTTTKEN